MIVGSWIGRIVFMFVNERCLRVLVVLVLLVGGLIRACGDCLVVCRTSLG